MDVACVSAAANDLGEYCLTSASRFLDATQRRDQPLAGHLLAISSTGVRRLAEPRFGA